MIDPNLYGKVVFITGANHGIGAETARKFSDQGAKVFVTSYRENTNLSSKLMDIAQKELIGGVLLYTANQQKPIYMIADEIRSSGGEVFAMEADLSDPAIIPQLFDCCEQELGPVDILVNNHTYCVLETFDPQKVDPDAEFPISYVSARVIDNHFIINARGFALLMAEYIQRYLRRGGKEGRIINISTDAAHAHDINVSYAASKHAIESYSRSAASELGKYGITVNIVAPGPIQTGYITPEQEKNIAASTPLGRVGQPEDVADVILFLASQQAHWLTGQLLYVGGGWRMSQ